MLELGKNIREGKRWPKNLPRSRSSTRHRSRTRWPPSTLGEAGRKLWQAVHRDYVVEDASGLEMLAQICAAADRVAEYRAAIDRDGPTVQSASGIKDHPLLRHELAAQSFIVRSLHRLGLDVIPPRPEVGRPPGPYRR